MNTIYQIAKSELKSLFYSPVAWLVLILFSYQIFGSYTNLVNYFADAKMMGYLRGNISIDLYVRGGFAPFQTFQSWLYLYIPLLTMGLMSREYSSGSIKLLYSSPITSTQIIMGKFLSMMMFGLVMVSMLIIVIFTSACFVKNLNIALGLSGVLGLYLLICAYSAVGLFMSTLTSYQIVAALGTLAALSFLNFVKTIGQTIDFVRDITYWLSISGRVEESLWGMICSEDILYFILVSGLFIALSILKLQFERQSASIATKIFKYTSVVVVVMLLGYITSRPSLKFFYDTTEHKQRTLTPVSQDILKQLDGPMTITSYVNVLDGTYAPLPSGKIHDLLQFSQYTRFKPEIKMEYIYYFDNVGDGQLSREELEEGVRRTAIVEGMNVNKILKPEEFKEIIDLSGEENRFVRVIESANGKKGILRVYSDSRRHPFENEISVALKTMITKKPVVGFLAGHNERSIHRQGDLNINTFTTVLHSREALVNQGFEPKEIRLNDSQGISSEIDILVIADPRWEFTDSEFQQINEFIEKGGNLIIATEARRQHILNPLIAQFGLEYMDGVLVEPDQDYSADLIFANFIQQSGDVSKAFNRMNELGIRISMPTSVGIKMKQNTGYYTIPFLATAPTGSWNELETINFNEKPTFNPLAGEVQGTIPTAVALTKNKGDKQQRIIVLGDTDCFSNLELSIDRDVRTANFAFAVEMFKWLTYGEFPLDMSRPEPTDNDIYLSQAGAKTLQLVLKWIFPASLLVLSIFVWLKRRSK